MPRKPSSVFLIAEQPNSTVQQGSMPATNLQAWRLELGDDTPEQVVERYLEGQTLGTTYYVVEDTKVSAYHASLKLDEIDDPRLGHEEEATP